VVGVVGVRGRIHSSGAGPDKRCLVLALTHRRCKLLERSKHGQRPGWSFVAERTDRRTYGDNDCDPLWSER
jgi:hypothetical protein